MTDSMVERARKHYEAAGRWAVAAEEAQGDGDTHDATYAFKMAELSVGLGILADHLSRPDVVGELIELRSRLTTVADTANALRASIAGFPVFAADDARGDLDLIIKLARGEDL